MTNQQKGDSNIVTSRQHACVVWMTGLSGAGKSTLATLLHHALQGMGQASYLLDGDALRTGLNQDLGFDDKSREENIRRIAHVAQMMVDAGLIVIVAAISPFGADRAKARRLFAAGKFLEVFIDTPLATAEKRDVKGLYKKARSGQLPNFTGISSPYEAPVKPEVHVQTQNKTPEQSLAQILEVLLSQHRA
jgi:bifunctional enzyme CysN/CysC